MASTPRFVTAVLLSVTIGFILEARTVWAQDTGVIDGRVADQSQGTAAVVHTTLFHVLPGMVAGFEIAVAERICR
jgi:hypothetical protein